MSCIFSVLQHGDRDQMSGSFKDVAGVPLLPADVSVQGAGR